jgi:hypothetical protein
VQEATQQMSGLCCFLLDGRAFLKCFPVQESSAEEIMEELGFSLMTPYGAEDIVYCIIDMVMRVK